MEREIKVVSISIESEIENYISFTSKNENELDSEYYFIYGFEMLKKPPLYVVNCINKHLSKINGINKLLELLNTYCSKLLMFLINSNILDNICLQSFSIYNRRCTTTKYWTLVYCIFRNIINKCNIEELSFSNELNEYLISYGGSYLYDEESPIYLIITILVLIHMDNEKSISDCTLYNNIINVVKSHKAEISIISSNFISNINYKLFNLYIKKSLLANKEYLELEYNNVTEELNSINLSINYQEDEKQIDICSGKVYKSDVQDIDWYDGMSLNNENDLDNDDIGFEYNGFQIFEHIMSLETLELRLRALLNVVTSKISKEAEDFIIESDNYFDTTSTESKSLRQCFVKIWREHLTLGKEYIIIKRIICDEYIPCSELRGQLLYYLVDDISEEIVFISTVTLIFHLCRDKFDILYNFENFWYKSLTNNSNMLHKDTDKKYIHILNLYMKYRKIAWNNYILPNIKNPSLNNSIECVNSILMSICLVNSQDQDFEVLIKNNEIDFISTVVSNICYYLTVGIFKFNLNLERCVIPIFQNQEFEIANPCRLLKTIRRIVGDNRTKTLVLFTHLATQFVHLNFIKTNLNSRMSKEAQFRWENMEELLYGKIINTQTWNNLFNYSLLYGTLPIWNILFYKDNESTYCNLEYNEYIESFVSVLKTDAIYLSFLDFIPRLSLWLKDKPVNENLLKWRIYYFNFTKYIVNICHIIDYLNKLQDYHSIQTLYYQFIDVTKIIYNQCKDPSKDFNENIPCLIYLIAYMLLKTCTKYTIDYQEIERIVNQLRRPETLNSSNIYFTCLKDK
ncbi:hypothetical protein cand_007680 [Cryptosporidium andersoni]|uniref:Uncharacterized protein n=1 Tax=Cryptosporidium andersoni TaxID=117008 RepID=A0A1J4MP98_9CRYT|nr:hypothetical protein cand_007680 [Cryptosporidium andersoni]